MSCRWKIPKWNKGIIILACQNENLLLNIFLEWICTSNIADNLQLFWPIIDSFEQLVSWQPYSCILGRRTQQIIQKTWWPIIDWVSYVARDRHNLLFLGSQQGFWEKYRQIESFEKLSNISSTTSMVAYGALKQQENSIHTWWREPSSWVHHPRFHDLKFRIRIRFLGGQQNADLCFKNVSG